MDENTYIEKQEFQLGEYFYYVYINSENRWLFRKERVIGVSLNAKGEILLKYQGSYELQKDCAKTLEEAKDKALKRWYEGYKVSVKELRELKEKE